MTFASAFLQQRKTNLTGRRREARLKMTSFQDFSGWHILLSLSGWPTGFAQKWIFLNKGITSWDEGETRPDLNRFRVFGNYFLVPYYAYSNLLILFQRLTRPEARIIGNHRIYWYTRRTSKRACWDGLKKWRRVALGLRISIALSLHSLERLGPPMKASCGQFVV